MGNSNYYIHHVPGRLRIRTPEMKSNHAASDEVKKMLSTMRGILTIYINLTTGSIIVHYDPDILHYKEIVNALHNQGYFDISQALTANGQYPDRSFSKAGKLVGEIVFSILVDKSLGSPAFSILSTLVKAAASR
jgi:copper chaperone CopZ